MNTEGQSVFRVALAQVNLRVGDIEGNARKIIEYISKAREKEAHLVAFPELSVTGYPPEDLILKSSFIRESQEALGRVVARTRGIIAVVGFPYVGGSLAGVPDGAGALSGARGGVLTAVGPGSQAGKRSRAGALSRGEGRKGAGAPSETGTGASFTPIYNAAAIAWDGKLVGVCTKILLPNYGVFDEKRYFIAGRTPLVFQPVGPGATAFGSPVGKGEHVAKGTRMKPGTSTPGAARDAGLRRGAVTFATPRGPRFGVNICEDIWSPGVAMRQAQAGALVVVNISSSPYHMGKGEAREDTLSARGREAGAVICYVNLVGGQDELVFDGESVVVGPDGRLVARAPQFEEALLVVDIDVDEIAPKRKGTGEPNVRPSASAVTRQAADWAETAVPQPGRARVVRIAGWEEWQAGGGAGVHAAKRKLSARRKPAVPSVAARLKPVEEVYRALVLGTRDYVTKNGFKKVAIGLSGGIDSSLVAAVAVDALGAENVRGVLMPSRYTSKRSNEDAAALAESLRVKTMTIPIEGIFGAYLSTLKHVFARKRPDITEENIQARIRGNILMALSNKFGWLVLTTGNKSEVAVGYSTLYGDTAGGFAVIKDVPKTLVYKLAKFRNSIQARGAIPRSVLTKAPTAELRPGQKDQDTLPSYGVLDPILEAYVEQDRSCDEIVAGGFASEVVDRVVAMVDASEYKRRQAPPGVKITPKAFGKDRRMPITNFYRIRER